MCGAKVISLELHVCETSGHDVITAECVLSTSLNKIFAFFLHCGSGARCSSVVIAFAHGAMGRRIDPSWGEPTELFLVPASAPRLV